MNPTTRLTVAEYDRMIDEGFFAEPADIRIELIEGELHHMSPIGVRHEAIVDRLNRWAMAKFPLDTVSVRIQQSLGIPAFDSVPQADVVIVAGIDFIQGRPLAEAVWLMIEVADSSLRHDRKVKGPLYAAAGIAEYWIVNIASKCLEVYRQPTHGAYADCTTLKAGSEIQPLSYPSAVLRVGELLAGL